MILGYSNVASLLAGHKAVLAVAVPPCRGGKFFMNYRKSVITVITLGLAGCHETLHTPNLPKRAAWRVRVHGQLWYVHTSHKDDKAGKNEWTLRIFPHKSGLQLCVEAYQAGACMAVQISTFGTLCQPRLRPVSVVLAGATSALHTQGSVMVFA